MDLLRSKCQCDKLQKQLKRYQNKFSDVVSSYKTIIEEKKVLEETLKTLSSKSSSCSTSKKKAGEASSGEANDGSLQEAEDTNEGSSSSSRDGNGSDESNIQLLEDKVAMLSKALNTVTEGKANMEAAFKNDRKSIIAEHAALMEKVREEKSNALNLEEETRSKLRQEQHEREDESKAHSLMLKELQEILAAERSEKDVLKLMLQEKDLSKMENKRLQEIGVRMSNSESEVNSETEQLGNQSLEEEQEENDRAEADQQMEQFRQNELNMEQMRSSQFEIMLADRQIQEEKRINELESRISELSAVVGNYDRKRQEDQSVIKKLRERLEHLELENSELSSQSPGKTEKYIYTPSMMNISNEGNDSTHQACQEEYKQLLEEFDNYKRKNKFRITRDSSMEEVEEHKKRICRLEKEIDRLKIYYEEKERANLKSIAGLQIDVTRSKEVYEERAENLSHECKLTVEQMECELRKQRERTMEVLADRDKEIERLQNKIYEFSGAPKESSSPCLEKQNDVGGSLKHDDASVVNEIFKKPPVEGGHDALFYFHQQVTHYDAELYTCRMQILDLESQVRDFEKREEQLLVQMQALKEEIRSLERNKSRESANLEYLKNICLQYMLTDSSSVKSQMSLAISTVLSFSPDEKTQLRKRHKGGWW